MAASAAGESEEGGRAMARAEAHVRHDHRREHRDQQRPEVIHQVCLYRRRAAQRDHNLPRSGPALSPNHARASAARVAFSAEACFFRR